MKKLIEVVVLLVIAVALTGCASLRASANERSGTKSICRPTGDVPKEWQVIHVISFESREAHDRVIWEEVPVKYEEYGKLQVMFTRGFYFWPGEAEPGLYLVKPDVETSIRLYLIKG